MPIFKYKAKKLTGEKTEGEEDALNPEELAREIRERGYVLTSFEEKKEGKKMSLSLFSFFKGVPLKEKMNFAKNLGVMAGSGISLVKGLEVLFNQSSNKNFKKILESLREKILQGKSLSEAMKSHPDVFPSLFQAMIKAGETSGKLEESLRLLALQMEQDYDLQRKIKGAMIYPAVILAAMVGIGIMMLIYVVPTLSSTFAELEIPLPATTLFIIALSNFIVNQSLLALFIVLILIFSVWYYFFKSESGRRITAAILLRLPVISNITKEVNTARTSRTLSSLISSGVNMLEALQITEEVLQNHYYKNVIKEARDEIQRGKPISSVLIRYEKIYPRMMGEMTAVGEETGRISEMLLNIANFYEAEVADRTKNLSAVVEPVLMLLIGAAVGFFAISMIQPMYGMVGAL